MAKIIGFTPQGLPGVRSPHNGREEAYAIAYGPGPFHGFGGLLDMIGGDAAAQQFMIAAWPIIDQKLNDKLLVIGAVAAVGYAGLVYLMLRKG